MSGKRHFKSTIGIVLSSVPGYSETFFRNKIKGLQHNGFEVILFVDYKAANTLEFPCEIVVANSFNGGVAKRVMNSLLVIFKMLFFYPNESFKLDKLDKGDGVGLKKRLRNMLLNQFLMTKKLDWLHFGFGMLAVDRENVAAAIGAKMAVSFRGFDLYLSPLKHENCYKTLFEKEVQYHVLSHEMKQDLMDYNVSSDKISIITPAIDINLFKYQNEVKKNDELMILTVARLHWKKGLEYTLEALAELKKAGVKFRYIIVGEGGEQERLMFAAHQLNISDTITFTGKMPQEAVKSHLEKADIYIQYSIQEGFCNAVLEAQAMGLLCIVSNAEGLSENVLDGQTGWVVPKRNPDYLANKILEVINLSSLEKNRIKQKAIERVQNSFNLEKQNDEFVAFYSA